MNRYEIHSKTRAEQLVGTFETMADVKNIADLISDPVTCQSLIGAKVIVILNNKRELIGYLAAFDPVSGSVILEAEGDVEYRLLMSDHISSLSFDPVDRIVINSMENYSTPPIHSPEEMEQRKSRILKIIHDAHLSAAVQDDGSIEIASVAVIRPPFKPDDIVTSNSIISNRLRELIQE